MQRIALVCLLLVVGMLSMFAALMCAFLTFATNDYRPIIAAGIGLSLLALSCFGLLIWRSREYKVLCFLVGAPTLIALAELLRRTAVMILKWLLD